MVSLFVWFSLVLAVPVVELRRSRPRPTASVEPLCGVRKVLAQNLIVEGSNAKAGEWPWHAAVYQMSKNGSVEEYKCGGTLISTRFVLTTASCGRLAINKKPGTVRVALGQQNLVVQSQHTKRISVAKATVHEEYVSGEIKNDVALFELVDAVQYTNYIQPACLPKRSERIESYDNTLGTVVGWGYTQTDQLAEELQTAQAPVIPYINCLESNPQFFSKVLYDGMFCGGFTNGTSVCFGDAGGGMFFQNGTIWTLRGMISFTDRNYGLKLCNPQHHFGLTNVVHFLAWIEEKVAAAGYQLEQSTSSQPQRSPAKGIFNYNTVLI